MKVIEPCLREMVSLRIEKVFDGGFEHNTTHYDSNFGISKIQIFYEKVSRMKSEGWLNLMLLCRESRP